MAQRDPPTHTTASILGNAPSICVLRDQIQHLASFDSIGNPSVPTLLLQGETGTGKGLVARVTHDSGPRANGPFIDINCAAIPENLLEAELFGFEAGAFTDAKHAKPGLFEAASGGTLFLDDVDALPISLQAKFLKVIEEKSVRRLGAVADHHVDVKVIAATQKDLQAYVSEGRFRSDLHHRLAVVILEIPPLRERSEDIVLLAQHFLRSCAEAHGLVPKRLTETADAWLRGYGWPGNVRELSHLMERATLLSLEPILDADTLERLSLAQPLPSTRPSPAPADGESEPQDEPARIREALTRTGGNVVQAARLLGLGRNALRYRMRQYRIESPSWEGSELATDGAPSSESREYRVLSVPAAAAHKVKRAVVGIWGKAAMTITVVLLVAVAVLVWNFYARAPLVPEAVTSKEGTVLSIPEKPSIAVLAFKNMSEDPKQDYFSDGISDNIITQLAKIPEMSVVARNSSFTYKDKPVKVQQIGQELGVRYVLEGSVQKAGERIRINAQLIDAATGEHLWADSYDRELKDMFAIQDDITLKIVKSLQVKLTHGESLAITTNATENVKAWEASVQGRSHWNRRTKEDNARARQLFQKAFELDPEFALMYSSIAMTHLMDSIQIWSKDPALSVERAEELAKKALAMDDSIPYVYQTLSSIYIHKKQYEKALVAAKRSVVLDPKNPTLLAAFAQKLIHVGRPEEGLKMVEKAIRLHPYYQAWIHRLLVSAYYYAGRYDKAITGAKEYLDRDPKRVSPRIILVASLVAAGREEEAREEAEKFVELHPKWSISRKARNKRSHFVRFKDPEHWERLANRLHQAGVTE